MTKLNTTISPSDLPDTLVSQGRYWATTAELVALTGRSGAALRTGLARLVKRGQLFSPARGFYVVVPAEYRSWRVVPAAWFIDPLMKHLKREYYVGFLSAAAMHGASHQAPQTFRVATNLWLKDQNIERVQLRFTVPAQVRLMPVESRNVHTGTIVISSRETTVVDLAWRSTLGGGISNVATVIQEIGELDGSLLARIAPLRNRTTVRRVGWLLEQLRPDVDTYFLRALARPDEGEPSLLVPGRQTGTVDTTWGLRVNTKIESDV